MMNLSDYENFCAEVINLNKSIRYIAVVDDNRTYTKHASGITNLLTPKESFESVSDAILRWDTRKKLSGKLGEPVYAMAIYKKVKRITIPINHRGLILVSINPDGYHEVIINEIIEIKNKYFNE